MLFFCGRTGGVGLSEAGFPFLVCFQRPLCTSSLPWSQQSCQMKKLINKMATPMLSRITMTTKMGAEPWNRGQARVRPVQGLSAHGTRWETASPSAGLTAVPGTLYTSLSQPGGTLFPGSLAVSCAAPRLLSWVQFSSYTQYLASPNTKALSSWCGSRSPPLQPWAQDSCLVKSLFVLSCHSLRGGTDFAHRAGEEAPQSHRNGGFACALDSSSESSTGTATVEASARPHVCRARLVPNPTQPYRSS